MISNLLAARAQMSLSLGFHIIFASIGMTMPILMVISHGLWLKTKQQDYLLLTKAWSKGVAILFATGAVSGTILSFELGLLWPNFMKFAGPIIGMPFSLEGTAFFCEAIAIGLFLYGWKVLPPLAHWLSGVVVGLSGIASGWFVVCANAWMNSPRGFVFSGGKVTHIDPIAAMFNAAWFPQTIHMILAAFEATGFAVAGVHALMLLKSKGNLNLHRKAFVIALSVGAIAALLQLLAGDLSAKSVAHRQPIKFAAMEAHYETQRGAPLVLGGVLPIPKALSFLAYGKFDAEVKGLNDFPPDQIPPVAIVRVAFNVMIILGTVLAALSILFFVFLIKKKGFPRWFLLFCAFATPAGFLALEAGWVVTEVGRQPWIIYGVMKTSEALTPMPGLVYPFALFSLIYLGLIVAVSWLMSRLFLELNKC